MKVKLDEDLPGRIVGILSRYGHDVTTVVSEGLSGNHGTTIPEVSKQ